MSMEGCREGGGGAVPVPGPEAGICPLCGQPNGCRLAAGEPWKGACWCQRVDMPESLLDRVPEAKRGRACVCRRCVEEERRRSAPPLVPGPGDYYLENGLWVFTAQYHLRRGYCCGSGCRHCPYDSGGAVLPGEGERA